MQQHTIVRKKIDPWFMATNVVLGLFFCALAYFFGNSLVGAIMVGAAFVCVAMAVLNRISIVIRESSGFDQDEADHGIVFTLVGFCNLAVLVFMDAMGWRSITALAFVFICTVGGVMYLTWHYSIQCKRCGKRWPVFRQADRRFHAVCRRCKYSELVADE